MSSAVLFDMDGLMLETRLTWVGAETELLRRWGRDYSLDVARRYQGMRVSGVVEVIRREFGLTTTQAEGERILTECLVANFSHPDLVLHEGCRELVRGLREAGARIAIASSSPRAAIEAMANRFGLTPYFQALVSGEEVPEGKPAPDVYLAAAAALEVPPENCVVLEDAVHGALAGRRAGCRVVAVYNKAFCTAADFDGVADLVVESLAELSPERLLAM